MDISLPPQLEELIKQKVESGRYHGANEVVIEALWLLDARDRFREMQTAELRQEIQKGLDSGPATPLDVEKIKAEGRKRLTERRAQKG